jgi:single-strand DNA-binding protein
MNNIFLTGHLGAEPNTFGKSGELINVTEISLAISTSYLNKNGEQINSVFWITCKAFKHTAKWLSHLKKGDKIAISGRLISESYVSKNGENRSTIKVQIEEFLKNDK